MIRVLVADDSPTFRAVMRHILAAAPDVEVVAEAADGVEAVRLTQSLRPDVVTLDVLMPRMSGLEALEEIMRSAPTPVVVVSALGEDQVLGFEALGLGAVEVVAKPQSDTERHRRQADAICMAVRAVAGLTLVGRRPGPARAAPAVRIAPDRERIEAVGIVASTGGPQALHRIFSALPASYPAAILVVQHIAPGFEAGLVRWIASSTRLTTKAGEHGEPVSAGTIYFAPAQRHLTLEDGHVHLDDGPPVKGFRPSGTVLLQSLAAELGRRAAGVILSGMGDDGVAGLASLRLRGGFTAAQGPSSSVVFGMPKVALERNAAAVQAELEDLAPLLLRLVA
jgi:two-component system chemotaxis response regulator CheB